MSHFEQNQEETEPINGKKSNHYYGQKGIIGGELLNTLTSKFKILHKKHV